MKSKLVEILFVVVLLLVPAFIAGCKDETEAIELKEWEKDLVASMYKIDQVDWEPTVAKELQQEQEVEFVENEPNEPDKQFLSLKFTDYGDYDIPEPNEPEYKIMIISISERINQLIPTWPDYIELEKDLVIEYEYDTGFMEADSYNADGTVNAKAVMQKVEYGFPKGTKIYFRDD